MTADNLDDALYERFPKNLGSEPDLRAAISREVRRLVRTDPPPDLVQAMVAYFRTPAFVRWAVDNRFVFPAEEVAMRMWAGNTCTIDECPLRPPDVDTT